MDWIKSLVVALRRAGAREAATPDVSLWVLPDPQVMAVADRCRHCGNSWRFCTCGF